MHVDGWMNEAMSIAGMQSRSSYEACAEQQLVFGMVMDVVGTAMGRLRGTVASRELALMWLDTSLHACFVPSWTKCGETALAGMAMACQTSAVDLLFGKRPSV